MDGLLRSWGLSIDSTRTATGGYRSGRVGACGAGDGWAQGTLALPTGTPGRETRPTGRRCGREVGACGAGAAGSEIQPYLEGGIEEAALFGGRRVGRARGRQR